MAIGIHEMSGYLGRWNLAPGRAGALRWKKACVHVAEKKNFQRRARASRRRGASNTQPPASARAPALEIMSALLHAVADAQHIESMVGPVSSHYEIGPVLGTGAFSKVFRGRPLHKHAGSSGGNEPETVALKIVDFNGTRCGACAGG